MADFTLAALLVSSLSLATLGNAAARPIPTLDLEVPTVFASDIFGLDDRMMTIPMDTCKSLRTDMQHNVGSISIPCAQTNNKKHMCSLYSDPDCVNLLSTWDHSHYHMMEHADNENGLNAIGSQVVSMKCSMVDISTGPTTLNSIDHRSTTHESRCVNENCNTHADCHLNADGYHYCSDLMNNTCQHAKFIEQGGGCREDLECITGYCSGSGQNKECAMKKKANTLCSQSLECDNGLKCCREVLNVGGRCTADCKQQDEMLVPSVNKIFSPIDVRNFVLQHFIKAWSQVGKGMGELGEDLSGLMESSKA
ncbi:hypothetical protein N7495_009073 [Penicillium taxi]|uniref:uncharacterized protein n=1 Tax=Penicillium taxi TaxID=168475 RepID=UPI0025453CDB|nr:uncharacterized protein N7495_009073 [Penicillium taxi]KAJ5889032.1 hypothetical protein N7495_009073 [Penicillium taxi]